jgi:hypothetical protein
MDLRTFSPKIRYSQITDKEGSTSGGDHCSLGDSRCGDGEREESSK